jgi:hypothetical protein
MGDEWRLTEQLKKESGLYGSAIALSAGVACFMTETASSLGD